VPPPAPVATHRLQRTDNTRFGMSQKSPAPQEIRQETQRVNRLLIVERALSY
jgi:hypothetical protein